jgi:hypothetical protein
MCTITSFIEVSGEIIKTPLFWDCKCEEDYIHPAYDEFCYRCHFRRDESPDSRAPEVVKYADLLPNSMVALVEAAWLAVDPEYCSIPF